MVPRTNAWWSAWKGWVPFIRAEKALGEHRWVGGWVGGALNDLEDLSQPGLHNVTDSQLGPACVLTAASIGSLCWSLPPGVRTHPLPR